MRPVRCTTTLLTVFAFLVTLISAIPAQAASPCSGTQSNYFLGYATNSGISSSYTYGVGSTFTVQPSATCTGQTSNFIVTWTMLSSLSRCCWVQSGFGKQYGTSGTYNFYQTYDGTNLVTSWYTTALSAGQTHKYVQKYLTSSCPSTTDCIGTYIDGTQAYKTPWDPNVVYGSTPWQISYENESAWVTDQPPGSSSAPMYMTGMQYFSGLNWYNFPCGIAYVSNDEPTHWSHSESDCSDRQTWDTRN